MGEDPRKLFVGQLPLDIREDEVRTIFGTYGNVMDVFVMDGKPPGSQKCAFVTYEAEESAQTAIQLLHDVYKFRPDSEKAVRVSVAKGKQGGGGGGWSDRRDSWNDWGRDQGKGKGGGKGDWGEDRGSWGRSSGWDHGRGGGGGREEDAHKVFVGQLPMDIREDEIRTIFGTYGTVIDVRIIDGKPVGSQKCAFVGYDSETGARAAIQVLNDVYKFRVDAPKAIRVEQCRGRKDSSGGYGGGGDTWDSSRQGYGSSGGAGAGSWEDRQEPEEGHKVFVGNLPMDIREDEVRQIFGTYGPVTDVKIIDGKPVGSQKCAFVNYGDAQGARTCIQLLHNVYKFRPDADRPIRVEFTRGGNPGAGGSGGGGGNEGFSRGGSSDWNSDRGSWGDRHSQGGDESDARKVFVGQLPLDILEEEIRMIFGTYGSVQSVYVMDGKPPGTNKVAFVEYAKPEEAQTSIAALHEVYKFRPDSEQPIRVSIAKPKNRDKGAGKGDKGGRDWDDRSGWRDNREWNKEGGWQSNRGYGDYDRSQSQWNNQRSGPYNRREEYGSEDNRGSGPGVDRPPGSKLHIGNLPNDISREALDTVFSTYGAISDIHIMQKHDGGQCAAFITYRQDEDAQRCVAAMEQGYEIRPGQGNINVSYARAKDGARDQRFRPY